MRFRIKCRPEDFIVSEVLRPTAPAADGTSVLLRLDKQGYTTFEVVQEIEAVLKLPMGSVGHAGLKDEDAITTQHLTITGHPEPVDTGKINRQGLARGPNRWFFATILGRTGGALSPGKLLGNAFRVTIRDLDKPVAEALEGLEKCTTSFLNYYDTQRFGVPEGPKLTHLVGNALLAGDYAAALTVLADLRTPESRDAQTFSDAPKEFFAHLDPRIVSFYYSAAASDVWNRSLRDAVANFAGTDTKLYEDQGIQYNFSCAKNVRTMLVTEYPSGLEYTQYRSHDGEITTSVGRRDPVVFARIQHGPCVPDDLHSDRWAAPVTFFLPSGCYATMAIRQHLLDTAAES